MLCAKSSELLTVYSKHSRLIVCRNLAGLHLWKEELTTTIKHKIENYWSSKLANSNFNHDTNKGKYYVLSMFPYPSGNLHMGHVRVYTISDTVARFQRMNNNNVFHPIGWDAFGLPAENAAIERGVAPDEWTKQNISQMKQQLQQLGCSFEWDREIATCDPEYYHWTQELFLKLFESGLAYQKEAFVNWDPVDQTVLADEQVDENGCSWRSGARVEKKLLKQWFIRTTRFAKALYEGLDDPHLQDWRDIIKIQKNWIGECNGVAFTFPLEEESCKGFLTLWTLAPEYLDKAKFIALSPLHEFNNYDGQVLINGTKKLHVRVTNPFNGEKLPIFITDNIEFIQDTNSHIGIPGVFENDAEFCKKFNVAFEPDLHKLNPEQAKEKQDLIIKQAQNLNVGGYWTSARLRDWLISRQRYWGTPIPIIHCNNCGIVPVPSQDLPVKLPQMKTLSKKGVSYLADCDEWVNTVCPKCGCNAKRETDTMDTFVDSSWYYLRYLDPGNKKEMFAVKKAKEMTPVDLYIGGKEHATLHLYYARFISHFLHSLGMLPVREPFKRLLVQGMVMGKSFRIKGTGKYLSADEVDIIDLKKNKAKCKESQEDVVISWEKMSKSKNNGVDPKDMFNEYGIDTTRLLILADVGPNSHRNWNTNTFPGVLNWQKRLWLTIDEFIQYRNELPPTIDEKQFKEHDDYMFDSRNFYVKGATFNYLGSQQISVAISRMQGLTNSLRRMPPAVFAHSLQFEKALACQIILLAPVAPHFASELWSGFVSAPNRLSTTGEIHWDKSVLEQKWPEIDNDYKLDLLCQINGEDVVTIKIAKSEIGKIDHNKALEMVIARKEVQAVIGDNELQTRFTAYRDYASVISIRVPFSKKTKKIRNN